MNKKEQYELDFWKKHGLSEYGRDFYVEKHKKRLDDFNKLYELPTKVNAALEVGCGPFGGMSLVYQADKWILVDLLADKYKQMITVEFEFVSAGIESLPLDDNLFDIVFCCNVLDHTDDYNKGVKEIYRVLKPSGLGVIHVHCRKPNELNVGHPHSFTYDEIESVFMKNGFKIKAKKTYWDSYDTLLIILEKPC